MKDPLLPLRHILDAIERLETYAAAGRSAYDAEPMRRDAMARNLEIIGEATSRLSEEVRVLAPAFSWRDPIGMRNWLIHGYDVIDHDIVWNTVVVSIPVLKAIVVGLLDQQLKPRGDD